MTCYKLTENGESDCRFGIEAETDGGCLRFECVTADRAAMETLVGLCNEYQLDSCHLEDILEDFLTDFCI